MKLEKRRLFLASQQRRGRETETPPPVPKRGGVPRTMPTGKTGRYIIVFGLHARFAIAEISRKSTKHLMTHGPYYGYETCE
jgi:hypothetical protein